MNNDECWAWTDSLIACVCNTAIPTDAKKVWKKLFDKYGQLSNETYVKERADWLNDRDGLVSRYDSVSPRTFISLRDRCT